MKPTSRLFVSGLLAVAVCAGAQIIQTNKMTLAQAVKIASRLKIGMEARDMWSLMETNSLVGYTVGGRFYGTTTYPLSDGCSISLRTEATPGVWTNSVLYSAYMHSNGVKIDIDLKKRP